MVKQTYPPSPYVALTPLIAASLFSELGRYILPICEHKIEFEQFLGSLFSHFAEQQVAQAPAGLQQQILQIASMPTMQTAHASPVVSTTCTYPTETNT